MRARLIFAIVSTIIEEIAIVVIVLWGLPELGIQIPLWVLALIVVAWLSYAVYTYRKGTKALEMESKVGLPDMIGTRGKVVSPLKPEGLVRVQGELWVAKSTSGDMEPETEIIVVGQERLKLDVSSQVDDDSKEAKD
jgi:membrane protein implicated in regulation of membrane protease activity